MCVCCFQFPFLVTGGILGADYQLHALCVWGGWGERLVGEAVHFCVSCISGVTWRNTEIPHSAVFWGMASPLSAFTNRMHPKTGTEAEGGRYCLLCSCRLVSQSMPVWSRVASVWGGVSCLVCESKIHVAGHAMNLGSSTTHSFNCLTWLLGCICINLCHAVSCKRC